MVVRGNGGLELDGAALTQHWLGGQASIREYFFTLYTQPTSLFLIFSSDPTETASPSPII